MGQVSVEDAQTYFDTYVLHTDAWDEATETEHTKSLNQAENDLYEFFSEKFNQKDSPLPDEAIFEQALWLLRIDDALQRAEMGVRNLSVDGINITVASSPPKVGPRAIRKIEKHLEDIGDGGSFGVSWTVI